MSPFKNLQRSKYLKLFFLLKMFWQSNSQIYATANIDPRLRLSVQNQIQIRQARNSLLRNRSQVNKRLNKINSKVPNQNQGFRVNPFINNSLRNTAGFTRNSLFGPQNLWLNSDRLYQRQAYNFLNDLSLILRSSDQSFLNNTSIGKKTNSSSSILSIPVVNPQQTFQSSGSSGSSSSGSSGPTLPTNGIVTPSLNPNNNITDDTLVSASTTRQGKQTSNPRLRDRVFDTRLISMHPNTDLT